ncbi:MAG: S-layer glycoprotein N-glycosyltransferase AglJ [Halobacteriota archaeon]
MADLDEVCVLIPTLNEAATIGDVVAGFTSAGFASILVIDGGSADATVDIAAERGAEVVHQSGTGKGAAVVEAMDHVDQPYVLMIDGDGTYRPADADAMLEPLLEGDADHVIGNRFADMEPGAMSMLNRIGNRLINRLFRVIHQYELHDILTGYRAFSVGSFRELSLSATGFGIEAEMTGEAVRHGQRIVEVPISYHARPDMSDTKLRPIRDGAVILSTVYLIARMNNPLFFFGSVGGVGILAGILVGLYVGYRWFVAGVSHEVLAVVSSFLIIFGFLLVMFGVLSDMIVSLHHEQRQRIDRLRRQLERDD